MSYIIRLDDACEKMDHEKWKRMETLLDKYSIKPLVGIIPYCKDPMMDKYEYNYHFWERVLAWERKGWTIAMHGYNHVYSTKNGGLNPINKRSEFAGETLDTQKEKIEKGVKIMRSHNIEPKVFFPPSHTFDKNTIIALKEYSNMRIISDTIADDAYYQDGITFVPQQAGSVRRLPFRLVTFCYHPNQMNDYEFSKLDNFLNKHSDEFTPFPLDVSTTDSLSAYDRILRFCYFTLRRIR